MFSKIYQRQDLEEGKIISHYKGKMLMIKLWEFGI